MRKKRRKSRRKKTVFALKFLFGVFILFSIFTFCHFVYNFVINWDKLDVSKIDIAGTKVLNPEYVKRLTGFRPGANIFSYHINPQIYAREKWIKKLKIVKDFPGRLVVKVTERKPLAVFRRNAGDFVVTVDGVVVRNIKKAQELYTMPRWDDFVKSSARKRANIESFLRDMQANEFKYYEKMTSLESDGEDLVLRMKNYMIYFGRPGAGLLKEKFKSVSEVLMDAAEKRKRLKYLDLRPFTKKMRSAIIMLKKGTESKK